MQLCERLEGRTLEGGWVVADRVELEKGMTGSNFSIGYQVERNGHQGFMKVLDISAALGMPDPAKALQDLTTAFNFERDILKACKGLSRVVTALDEGSVVEKLDDRVEVAQYIIFELAQSDLRKFMLTQQYDSALNLRTLHHVATGLEQLHARNVAHQDLKPSNVLLFGDEVSKIADLGRSSARASSGPHDDRKVPGDMNYAPPELLYGHVSADWDMRRRASDLYQLGSLAVFAFTGVGMTTLLNQHTHPSHRMTAWSGPYRELLGYLIEYFRLAMSTATPSFPEHCREKLCVAVSELCDPDPSTRGHPRNHATGDPYGLRRYVSLFNRLAVKEEMALKKVLK